MQKVGKLKILKGKCPNCENKFIATADDFIMTQNRLYGTLSSMVRCPYCHDYLYKTTCFSVKQYGKNLIGILRL